MTQVHILLGGNIGDRQKVFEKATKEINKRVGELLKSSSYYETAAWGIEDQAPFLNQVILVNTNLSPKELLTTLLDIEKELGRIRFQKWTERVIDLDILFIEEQVIDTDDLKVPHPFIQERRFTLVPLVEISPDFIHPVFNQTLPVLLKNCPDKLEVNKLQTIDS